VLAQSVIRHYSLEGMGRIVMVCSLLVSCKQSFHIGSQLDNFKYFTLLTLNPDSARNDIKNKALKPITKEVYSQIVQNDSLLKRFEDNKHYFYAYDKKYSTFTRIVVANDLEMFTELECFQFDKTGELLDRRILVASGGDYEQWVYSNGIFLNDTLFQAKWKSGGDADDPRFRDSILLYVLDSKIIFRSNGAIHEQRAESKVWEKRGK
jgi:hypothetical protein